MLTSAVTVAHRNANDARETIYAGAEAMDRDDARRLAAADELTRMDEGIDEQNASPCAHATRFTVHGRCAECVHRCPPKQPTLDMIGPPEEWCRAYGVHIYDPDGWRLDGAPAWDEPISLVEFWGRAQVSTTDVANPGWEGVSRDARHCLEVAAGGYTDSAVPASD
jgi:hypothetical protein